jgi:hypothetical protein
LAGTLQPCTTLHFCILGRSLASLWMPTVYWVVQPCAPA